MAENYGPVEGVYKVGYSENVKLAFQQRQSRIEPTMSYLPNVKGYALQALDVIGETEARIDGAESSATPIMLPPHEAIWVKPRRLDWGTTIRRSVELKAAIDYTSSYVQNGVTAIRKAEDNKLLIPAILGPRLVKYGEDEEALPVSVAFDTVNQQIPANYGAGGPVGLTVKKLVYAIEKLAAAEIDVDAEMITLGLTAKQNSDLYGELQFTSKDYRSRAVFDEKRITEFMGLSFVMMQGLPTGVDVNGATGRRCPLYAKNGVAFGNPMPPSTMLERDPSLQYQVRPYIDSWWAATRLEDKYVVDIICAES